jgi:hypothetical protein
VNEVGLGVARVEAPRRAGAAKKKGPGGSVQAFEKARFGQGNPRKSKPFPLIVFASPWFDFAGFG